MMFFLMSDDYSFGFEEFDKLHTVTVLVFAVTIHERDNKCMELDLFHCFK